MQIKPNLTLLPIFKKKKNYYIFIEGNKLINYPEKNQLINSETIITQNEKPSYSQCSIQYYHILVEWREDGKLLLSEKEYSTLNSVGFSLFNTSRYNHQQTTLCLINL